MEKKVLYLTALISVVYLQTTHSAYRVNQTDGLPPIEKGGAKIYPSGVNAVPREISPGKGPVQPMTNVGSERINNIKKAIDTLNNETGSNLKLNCFSGTQYGPVAPKDVVVAKFENPTYQKGMVGAGKDCYLVFTPQKGDSNEPITGYGLEEAGHFPVEE